MDKDFHYYGIGFIARAAGFNKKDALTIAYASQYVDNSTESEPIRVGDRFFDPVRTAHNGLKAFNWGVQKRVYIPFHFIPPNPFMASPESFTFITTPDSPFAGMIFENACREPDELSRLISIGIALHTLADTWAHRGFSGMEEPVNDVEAIYHYKNGSWKRLTLPNIYLDILPKAGHAQAGHFPDLPYLRWKYTRIATKERIERDNTTDFLNAAQKIHQLLITVNKTDITLVIPWEEIKASIQEILINPEPDADKRCIKWQDYFKKAFGENSGYKYNARKWRKEALSPKNEKDVAWDQYEPSDFKKLSFSMTPGFYNTPWVKFHRAALRQRNFVLEHII